MMDEVLDAPPPGHDVRAAACTRCTNWC